MLLSESEIVYRFFVIIIYLNIYYKKKNDCLRGFLRCIIIVVGIKIFGNILFILL